MLKSYKLELSCVLDYIVGIKLKYRKHVIFFFLILKLLNELENVKVGEIITRCVLFHQNAAIAFKYWYNVC